MLAKNLQVIGAFSLYLTLQVPSFAREITIATGEFPPLYTAKTSTNGIVLQIVKEALKAVDIIAKFQFVPWVRANQYGENGQTDGSCCWYSQEERAFYAYYSQPVFAYSYTFFHLKTTPFDWNRIEDLKGVRLGGTQAYTYSKEFTAAEKAKVISVQRASSDTDNFKKLFSGRIEAFPLNTEVGYYILKNKFPAQAGLVTNHPKPVIASDVHLVFAKNNGQSEVLLAAFNKGLKIIHENGRYQQIIDDYEKSK